ncbi:MAG: efflux RND transporter permease subunit [Acidobacteriota bacterium]
MKLVDASIRFPVSVTVGVILVVLFGALSLFRIPVQMIPDVDRPQVTVTTVWPGASPEEIETEIVQKQEDELKTIEGMVEMTSESNDSLGRVVMKFETGSDIDASLLRVNNKLEQVRDYPTNALKPVISTQDEAEGAMAWFLLRARAGNHIDIETQRDFVEDVIQPALERVPGVAASGIFGGRERELQVIVDPHALAGRGLTLSQVGRALDAENNDVSAGDFDEGKRRYVVRTMGKYRSPEEVEEVVLAWRQGAPVYVRDVATVRLGFQDAEEVVRQRGEPTIAINASRQTGANALYVMAGLRSAVAQLNAGTLADNGMVLEEAFAESDYIEGAISLVQQNIVIGGLLAVLTLLLFLRSFSSTLVIGLAIPVSIMGTFLAMTMLGRNINVVSLAGLAFAVGMIVDASIVVLENIYRHQQLGKNRRQAAYDGAREVWGAVLASVLTTVAVFLPVLFVQEEAGQLFRDIAVAVSAAVLISLAVSITLIPSLAARVLQTVTTGSHTRTGAAVSGRGGWRNLWGGVGLAHAMTQGVGDAIYRLSASVRWRLAIILVLTGGAVLLAWGLMPPTEYLPTGNQNFAFGALIPPPGYNVDEYISIAQHVEGRLRPYWEAKPFTPEAAALDGPPVGSFFFVARGSFVFVGARVDPEVADQAYRIVPVIQRAIGGIPGTIGVVQQRSIFQRGPREAGRAIDIDLSGPDLTRLIQLGGRIFSGVMAAVPGGQARPIPSLDLGNPEVRVIPDRARVAELGLTAQELGFDVNALVDGVKVSEYQYHGRAIDLMLLGAPRFSSRSQDIGVLTIATPVGRVITVADAGRIVPTSGPEQINHLERQRSLTIQVVPPAQLPLETAMQSLEDDVLGPMRREGLLGGLYEAHLAGTADKLTATRRSLQGNFVLALVVTYLLMAALFESFLYPLVILFSVPFAAVGGFLGLAAVNAFLGYQALDVIAMLGFVILIGIVVNNAILIVHQSLNYMRDHGLPHREALREAVSDRMRPIFMSTITSVVGMAPLVLFQGAGSEIYRGLGSVVVGGLALSTLFTLLLVPLVFSLVMDLQDAIASAWRRRTGAASAEA